MPQVDRLADVSRKICQEDVVLGQVVVRFVRSQGQLPRAAPHCCLLPELPEQLVVRRARPTRDHGQDVQPVDVIRGWVSAGGSEERRKHINSDDRL